MGLLNFFKKKLEKDKSINEPEIAEPDANAYLIDELGKKLTALNYDVEKQSQYAALTINNEIEIATAIIQSPEYHPKLIHLLISTIHKTYFPKGIEENLVGAGFNMQEKVESVLNNYLTTTFPPIIESFSDSHQPELDFITTTNNREILWHPKLGSLSTQGNWSKQITGEPVFEVLKDAIKNQLVDKKINWLKAYISKQSDGTVAGECLLNNQVWQNGYDILCAYATEWDVPTEFLGQKQFITFRRCDAYDE